MFNDKDEMQTYDPDPHRRRKGHRKGVEPAGLKRWRLAHKHRGRYDPPHRKHSKRMGRGPRGGYYFQGPHKRRYDPPHRSRRARSYGFGGAGYARGPLGKVEHGAAKHGLIIGLLLGILPIINAWNRYKKVDPNETVGQFVGYEEQNNHDLSSIKGEVMTLVGQDPRPTKINPIQYLQYKFTNTESAWCIPFWASLAAFIAARLNILPQRINRILKPVSTGALAATTIGALTLPGCPSSKVITMQQDTGGRYVLTTPQQRAYWS